MIHMTTIAWACVIYVRYVCIVGAYMAWNAGVEDFGAGRAQPLHRLAPCVDRRICVLMLHEQIYWMSLVGGAVTIIWARCGKPGTRFSGSSFVLKVQYNASFMKEHQKGLSQNPS